MTESFDWLSAISWGLVAIGAGSLLWGILIERHLYTVRRDRIECLPAGSTPFRVLLIGDIHLAPWQRRRIDFVRSLSRLEPDLVVSTGDLLGHKNSIPKLLEALSPLGRFPGAFVHGSNDYHAPVPRFWLGYLWKRSQVPIGGALDIASLENGLTGFGWTNLNNRGALIELPALSGQGVLLLGVDDAHEDRARLSTIAEGKAQLLGQASGLTLGVTHAPYRSVLSEFASVGTCLVFAGHTHGGQVRLPIFGALVTNCDLPRVAARGYSTQQVGSPQRLIVTAGLGHSIFAPIRFFCRPEVRLIELLPVAETN